mmetsp:Transcript_9303/g.17407  ORF Transcript_9303/g.17407 Transcript_9303/m.17407 type:complete len:485 (-) Transcript_9303:561-2015(-)
MNLGAQICSHWGGLRRELMHPIACRGQTRRIRRAGGPRLLLLRHNKRSRRLLRVAFLVALRSKHPGALLDRLGHVLLQLLGEAHDSRQEREDGPGNDSENDSNQAQSQVPSGAVGVKVGGPVLLSLHLALVARGQVLEPLFLRLPLREVAVVQHAFLDEQPVVELVHACFQLSHEEELAGPAGKRHAPDDGQPLVFDVCVEHSNEAVDENPQYQGHQHCHQGHVSWLHCHAQQDAHAGRSERREHENQIHVGVRGPGDDEVVAHSQKEAGLPDVFDNIQQALGPEKRAHADAGARLSHEHHLDVAKQFERRHRREGRHDGHNEHHHQSQLWIVGLVGLVIGRQQHAHHQAGENEHQQVHGDFVHLSNFLHEGAPQEDQELHGQHHFRALQAGQVALGVRVHVHGGLLDGGVEKGILFGSSVHLHQVMQLFAEQLDELVNLHLAVAVGVHGPELLVHFGGVELEAHVRQQPDHLLLVQRPAAVFV